MALTRTTLSGAVAINDKTIRVASATGFVVGQVAKIDSEEVRIAAQNADTLTEFTVIRGYNSTTAVAHNTGAPVTTGVGSDWSPALPQPAGEFVYSYAAAGAILPVKGQHQLLTGAASAMTLALPKTDQDGDVLTIVSTDARAYTIVVPTAFQGADTGVTATFGGAAGDNLVIQARNGLWVVLSVGGVSIA